MKTSADGPAVLILGTAKGGTTTLFNLLNFLPGLSGSRKKEIRYFSMDYYYRQGPEWYHAQFDEESPSLKFEATPHYLYFPTVPERVHSYERAMQKEMKFIVLLREPVSRCYSAWNMERSFHQNNPTKIIEEHYRYYNADIRESLTALLRRREFPSFSQAVSDDVDRLNNGDPLLEPSYVRKGIYCEQIVRWLQWFDLKRFLFIEFQELSQPFLVLKKLERFLELHFEDDPVLPAIQQNVGHYPLLSSEDAAVMEMLKKLYYPYNEQLFNIIGKRYDWNDEIDKRQSMQPLLDLEENV